MMGTYWDIKPVCPTAHLHYGIRRFFRQLPTRGVINESMAVLFIYDPVEPCRSRILKEVTDNRITRPETAVALAKAMIENHKRIDK